MSVRAQNSALLLVRDSTRGARIKAALGTQGVTVIDEAADSENGLPLIEEREPALLVVELDATSGERDGGRNDRILDFVEAARERAPKLNVIACVETLDPVLFAKTIAKGVDGYVLA